MSGPILWRYLPWTTAGWTCQVRPSLRLKCYSNCKRKRRLLAITYCKIRIQLRSPGGPILVVREAEPLVFLLVFAGVGQFHLQFEMLPFLKESLKNPEHIVN